MNKQKFVALSIFFVLSCISCKKNSGRSSKYVGVAITSINEVRRVNDSQYYYVHYDTLDFEAAVVVKGKYIHFLSPDDSIIKSYVFAINDSSLNNNTYSSSSRGFSTAHLGIFDYKLKNDSLVYTYHYGTVNSYRVRFTGLKQ